MSGETLVLGKSRAALGQGIETSTVEDVAHRVVLQKIVDGYGGLDFGEAAGGNDVSRPQGEVAEGEGCLLAQKDGAGIAYPWQHRQGDLDGQLQVLRRVIVDELDALGKGFGQDGTTVLG